MYSHALTCPSLRRRRSRALFLTRNTQHVDSMRVAIEVTRAVLALGALAAWSALALLVAG